MNSRVYVATYITSVITTPHMYSILRHYKGLDWSDFEILDYAQQP